MIKFVIFFTVYLVCTIMNEALILIDECNTVPHCICTYCTLYEYTGTFFRN